MRTFAIFASVLMLTIVAIVAMPMFVQDEEGPLPRVIAITSEWSGFVDNVEEWGFFVQLVTPSPTTIEARFIGAQVGDSFVPDLTEDKNEWKEVARIERQAETPLGKYKKWHQLVVEKLAADDEFEKNAEDYVLTDEIKKNYTAARKEARMALKETEGRGVFEVRIPSIPLKSGETVAVGLVFEVREVQAQDIPDKSRQSTSWRVTIPTSVTKLTLPPQGIKDNST